MPTSHVVNYLDSLMQGIMRSFTSCQATDMDQLFVWISLLLTYMPVTEGMERAESSEVILRKTGQNAVLPCTASTRCSPEDVNYEWFSFKQHSHVRLNLTDIQHKYSLDGSSLHIKSLHTNDSAIYYCAASCGGQAPGREHVGSGTILRVREHVKIMVRRILLWLSFVLLAIYSSVLVTLLLKKYGCKTVCRRKRKTVKNNSTKKTQFRDVLQELYSRRNLERSKQTANRKRSQAEAPSTEFNSQTDDVYQNV
ncbi:uncharacterized protein si:ch211-139g16.8 isoform X1 [Micropterus dolomieu]|uniref:uncharacterized protein LOC123956634 n=3 Tax=Micropterus dolomieu TaxID=147949 RepID=UPI001E8DEFDC|nr:uncharacterized protein LOC123956634 [Micropterus dolomieu]XP_045884943.1 uncharacterized protein si:ch211-139g16.8 isoform X1 [Micropterus dolomieu]